jgi:hypothetical protein
MAAAAVKFPTRWTPRRVASAEQYVRSLADRLGLRDWEIRIDVSQPSDGCAAEINCYSGQKRAVISPGTVFWTADALVTTPEEIRSWQRHTLVHELIHCHLASARETTSSTLEALTRPKAAEALFAAVDLQLEYATDALADVLAPSLPLPPW